LYHQDKNMIIVFHREHVSVIVYFFAVIL